MKIFASHSFRRKLMFGWLLPGFSLVAIAFFVDSCGDKFFIFENLQGGKKTLPRSLVSKEDWRLVQRAFISDGDVMKGTGE